MDKIVTFDSCIDYWIIRILKSKHNWDLPNSPHCDVHSCDGHFAWFIGNCVFVHTLVGFSRMRSSLSVKHNGFKHTYTLIPLY